MPRSRKADAEYQVFREPGGPDPRGRFRKIDTTANAKGGRNVPSLHYGVKNPYSNEVVYPRDGTCWRHSETEMKRLQDEGRLYWGVNGTSTTPMRKLFLSEAKQGMSTPSILPEMPLNQHAARELEVLFGKKGVFDTPKPVELLRLLVQIGSGSDAYRCKSRQITAEYGEPHGAGVDPGDCRAEAGTGHAPGRRFRPQRPNQGERRADLQNQGQHQLQDGVEGLSCQMT